MNAVRSQKPVGHRLVPTAPPEADPLAAPEPPDPAGPGTAAVLRGWLPRRRLAPTSSGTLTPAWACASAGFSGASSRSLRNAKSQA